MELPMGLSVCFMEGNQQIGKLLKYKDPARLFEILRATHAQQEDHQAVEEALCRRTSGSVELNLSEEQYSKLKRGK